MEQLLAELRALRADLDALRGAPLLHRKDVQRLLGVSAATLTRRMSRRDFPQPIRDAGRPKWSPGQFNGQANGQGLSG